MNDTKVRVIGAGCGRTGTKSLKLALQILGHGPCYHMSEVIGHAVVGHGTCFQWSQYAENPTDLDLLHSMLGGSGYASTCDFPASIFWKEQVALYPDAKVILTAPDPEEWYKSCCDTIFSITSSPGSSMGITLALALGFTVRGMSEMVDRLLSTYSLHGDLSKENVIKTYIAHNEEVVRVCPKDKLLVFDVNQGWEPLCKFLEVDIPDVPFPLVNETEDFQKNIALLRYDAIRSLTYGTAVVLGYSTVIVGCAAAAVMASWQYV